MSSLQKSQNAMSPGPESLPATNSKTSVSFGLPAEVILQIFYQIASHGAEPFSADRVIPRCWETQLQRRHCPSSSEGVLALASSSRSFYEIFKENELAILRRAVIQIVGWRGRTDGALANHIIKIGILRLDTAWPTKPDDLKRAFDTVSTPIQLPTFSYGQIITWLEGSIQYATTPRNTGPFEDGHLFKVLPLRARQWMEERGDFLQRNFGPRGLFNFRDFQNGIRPRYPNFHDARHPYDCVNPQDFLVVPTNNGPFCYSDTIRDALRYYTRHANEPVTEVERILAGMPDYVPCCFFKTCPRNW